MRLFGQYDIAKPARILLCRKWRDHPPVLLGMKEIGIPALVRTRLAGLTVSGGSRARILRPRFTTAVVSILPRWLAVATAVSVRRKTASFRNSALLCSLKCDLNNRRLAVAPD